MKILIAVLRLLPLILPLVRAVEEAVPLPGQRRRKLDLVLTMLKQVYDGAVEKLIPYARNARTHSDEQVAQIAASIAEFGWANPILTGADGIIIAGHARLLAARKLGMTEVPVIVLDHSARRGGAP